MREVKENERVLCMHCMSLLFAKWAGFNRYDRFERVVFEVFGDGHRGCGHGKDDEGHSYPAPYFSGECQGCGSVVYLPLFLVGAFIQTPEEPRADEEIKSMLQIRWREKEPYSGAFEAMDDTSTAVRRKERAAGRVDSGQSGRSEPPASESALTGSPLAGLYFGRDTRSK